MYTPLQIYKLCNFYGYNKVKTPIVKLLILSIIGGFFVGSGALMTLICSYRFVGGLAQYYSGLVFPIGMMAAYCAGGELFTENCLLIIPFFANNITLLELLLTWLISFIGNFIGAILLALLVVYSHVPNMFEVNLAQNIIINGINKCSLNFGETLIQGLLCNMFNCLAVWVSLGGKDLRSKILGLWTPLFLIAACELEHSVANMFYITAGLFASYEYGLDSTTLNWGRLFYKNILPVTLGNILGGALIGLGYSYIYINAEPKNPPDNNENTNIRENNQNSQANVGGIINETSHGFIRNDLSTINSINK